MLEKFEEEWRPAVENLEQAALAFDDLEGARTPLHSIGVGPVKSVQVHYVLCMIRYNMCTFVESLLSGCGSGFARLGRRA